MDNVEPASLNNVELTILNNVELANMNNIELGSMDNVELVTMNNVQLTNMNNVELANMNNVLASMFYRFPTILFIHPLNGQPHLNFIFCRIMMTTRKMIKSNLKYRLQKNSEENIPR